jgi:hypothetical protein
VFHRHFGEEAMKAAALGGGLAAVSLVLVDDQDPFAGPAQGDGVIDQGVLALA